MPSKGIQDIMKASTSLNDNLLKPITRPFKKFHVCDATLLRVKGIHKVYLDGRGGDWRKKIVPTEGRMGHAS